MIFVNTTPVLEEVIFFLVSFLAKTKQANKTDCEHCLIAPVTVWRELYKV